jgi:hypothetical protein
MSRALTAVGALLVLCLLILGLAVYLGRDEDNVAVDNLLSEDITRAIGTAEDRGADVDLGKVANFEWDELLVAERDVTRAQLTRELGHPWKGELEFRTGDLLIFLRDGAVARFADYRGEGRFEGVKRPIARIDRDAAVFRVRSLVIRPLRPPS